MSLQNNNTGQMPTDNGMYGYYCNNCQIWVPSGVSHVCGNIYPQLYPQYYGSLYVDNTILERIAKALEELVELKKKGL